MPLRDIPVGIDIHNVEIQPGAGGKIARSTGTSVTISGLDGNYSLIKLALEKWEKRWLKIISYYWCFK